MTPILAQTSSLFTAPVIAGAAVAAVSIPVIIHLLWRVKRQRQVWAAMRFLQVAIKKQKNKLRLEHLLLLLTRCLMLLLLGLGLAGPVGQGLSQLFVGHSGRKLVHLVIDDTLTSQAQLRAGVNRSRLDELKEQASKLIDQMGEEDHLAIWRSAKAAAPMYGPGLVNAVQARQILDSIQSRHTASDLPAVLANIQAQLDDATYSAYEQTVVILSDFSHGSLGQQSHQSFDKLARQATVSLAKPAISAANMQIVKLQPRRSQMLRPLTGSLAVMLDVSLSREGKIDQPAVCTIGLFVDGKQVASRQHQWTAGQSQATVQMDLSWDESAASFPFILPIEARLTAEPVHNRLTADDRQFTQVQLREELKIALVDDGSSSGDAKGFTPAQWLTFALSPAQNNLNVMPISPGALTGEVLSTVDVCMLLRPDQISGPQLEAVEQWTRAGGLLWVFTPAVGEKAGLPVWALNLAQKLELPVKMDVKVLEGDWALTQESRPPDALGLLGADWQALLRPVRVLQMLGLFAPLGNDSNAQAWLRLNDEAQSPVLVSQQVDDGFVLFSALALNPQWSNLQTRPLFVPLLHESIASLTSQSASRRLLSFTPGTKPELAKRFASTDSSGGMLVGPKRMSLQVGPTGRLIPTQPLDEPGVYRSRTQPSRNVVLINVDATDGSLVMTDEHAVRQLLFESTGNGQSVDPLHWLDRDNPTWAVSDTTVNSQLGWHLLWLAMALLIIETMLARWFSHASTQQRTWSGWIWHGILKLLHLDHTHAPRMGKGGVR
ncbi:MAG: BatA domain-containing protein [Phycisphaeraceae bacterium JB051]